MVGIEWNHRGATVFGAMDLGVAKKMLVRKRETVSLVCFLSGAVDV